MQVYSVFGEKKGLVVNISVNVPVSRLLRGRQKESSGHMVTPRLVAVASLLCFLRSPRTVQVAQKAAKCSKSLCKQGSTVLFFPSLQCLRDGKEWERGWCLSAGRGRCLLVNRCPEGPQCWGGQAQLRARPCGWAPEWRVLICESSLRGTCFYKCTQCSQVTVLIHPNFQERKSLLQIALVLCAVIISFTKSLLLSQKVRTF